jgi:predicted metalloprotease with PDZ domain
MRAFLALACMALLQAPLLAQIPAPLVGWQPQDVAFPGTIRLRVDATDVSRGIFRVTETIPVHRPGRLTLLYPKWVPGEHAASAPLERFAGLVIRAAGRPLRWKRDPIDMHAFHIDVPPKVANLEVEFQFLTPTNADQGRVVATMDMLNLQWFSVAMYPAGYFASRITVQPEVTLPVGWKLATQLEVASSTGATTLFQPSSLETLLDSPIFAGRHFRAYNLGKVGHAPVSLNVVADKPEYLDAGSEGLAAHRRLVEQVGLLFGRPPFERYDFLLALTREMGSIGMEHLASSENTSIPEYFTDWKNSHVYRALLPHEMAHSWNGKARRPEDIWSPDFNLPMRTSLLWVYEGQTSFWGFVLAARSGLMSQQQVMDVIARLAASHAAAPGRAWRPMADTSNDPVVSRGLISYPWPSWHRTVLSTYEEGNLMWLEADGIIRSLSRERRSLDDFAHAFFSGGGKKPSLYNAEDVIAALDRLQPYDWREFLRARLETTTPDTPTDWLSRSGYRLVYTDVPTEHFAAFQKRGRHVDLSHSLGLFLADSPDGIIREVIWDSPAFQAELTAGSVISSVNGQPYSSDLLKAAIQKNRSGESPIELAVNARNRTRTVVLDYRGGLRYPRLQRISSVPDRLRSLLMPRSQPAGARDAPGTARHNPLTMAGEVQSSSNREVR